MAIRPLSEDMDIIQGLVIPGIDADLDIIQKLDDEPNDVGGLSPAELKEHFDRAGNILKRYINGNLLPGITDTTAEAEIRAKAEEERIEGEKTRTAAEEVRVTAESGRAAAEQGRREAETGRVTAEQARAGAEADRAQAETERRTAETQRGADELRRRTAEQERRAAEEERLRAEEERLRAEAQRQAAETRRLADETERLTAEQERLEAEAQRKAAEEVRKDKYMDLLDRAIGEADRAEAAAERTADTVEGNFATRSELTRGLNLRAGAGLVGPAELVGELLPGGLLFVTEGDAADYEVSLEAVLAAGYEAAKGGEDMLDGLITVGRAKALALRSDLQGTPYNEGTLPGLKSKLRSLCAAAVGTAYETENGLELSQRQVQYYILHGVLVSHAEAERASESWSWTGDPETTTAALRREIGELRATVGDLRSILDTVLDGEAETETGGEADE